MKIHSIYYLIFALLLVSCQPTLEEFSPEAGNADFSSYLAVGNSLTAGYTDGALYRSGQENSYPNIIAQQLMKVGGGDFKQPLMLDDYGVGFNGIIPIPKLVLGYSQDCLGATSLAPVRADVEVDLANLASIADQGPFNNMAVPGMQSSHLSVNGYAALNPYFGRMVSAPTNSVMDEIMRVDATFFTIWLGSNDVLGYAGAGGEGPQITPVEIFTQSLENLIDYLTSKGMKGAIGNVPNVLESPFFTTIPFNALPLTEQMQVDQLNQAYAPLNQLILANNSTDTIHFSLGANPLVIQDASLPWGMRQIKKGELLLLTLPQDSIKCAGWGSQVPVPSGFVLDNLEIEQVENAIFKFNQEIIKMIVNKPVVLVDLNKLLSEAYQKGIQVDGVTLTSELVTGNLFSLDGLHLTPIASAVAANEFIKAINSRFSSNIPMANPVDYQAVIFP